MKRLTEKQLQNKCDSFNAKCEIGDVVSLLLDSGDTVNTVTISAAQVLSGHSAVVWLSGVRGCYLIDRVTILKE